MQFLVFLALLTSIFAFSPKTVAQLSGSPPTAVSEIVALSKAKNLARQAAESVNGGIEKYTAEKSMHGDAAKSPFINKGDHWLFTFRGGPPGFVTPTVESEVRVDKTDFKTSVIYNGPIHK